MPSDAPCPSAQILRRSLDPDDPMPEPERQRIEAHVDQCDRGCKTVIEAVLRGNSLPATPGGTQPDKTPSASAAAGTHEDATLASNSPAPLIQSLTLPGYEILEEIGRGGMGVVYKARHIGLHRLVALKMILAGAHAGDEELARFRTEAKAVAALQHANVVQIYEIGEQEGRPYFSLEFVEGGNLAQKLAGVPQPPAQAAELIETLARAVHFAHQRGVVHRDLKPANVLLSADGQSKITDFGLAKRLEGSAGKTQSGAVMGTPSYMAPEQAGGRSKEVGAATDVYALGAILYECLTGRPPFKAATTLETLQQVIADDPAPPRQLQSKTPRDLETICLKCLEKRSARRYATAAELADDLGRWRRGEPVRARPPSLGYLLRKRMYRYRAPLAVALGMLLVLAAVTAAAFVQVLGARDEAVRKSSDLQKTLDSLNRQLSILASNYADRSDVAYHAGNVYDSLTWMLRAYEVAPTDDPRRSSYLQLIGEWGRSVSGRALPHDGSVYKASFSPDGRTVVTASADKTARLWDVASGKELQGLLHEGPVNAASFSPDGRTVVTASDDKTARLWDAASGKELHRLSHDDIVIAASFSPDGRTVVTASGMRMDWRHSMFDEGLAERPRGEARLWDAASGKELQRLTHDDMVNAASFSPDARTVVTASDDKTARLWDAGSGKELRRLTHVDAVNAASFSPDGHTIVTAAGSPGEVPHLLVPDDHPTIHYNTARLWDVATGKELQEFRLDYPVGRAFFSPDGRTVVTCNFAVRLWDAASGKELLRLMEITGAASFSPDGRTLATSFGYDSARLWDAASGKELQRLMHTSSPRIRGVFATSFSPDGRTVVTASDDGFARLWEVGAVYVPDDVDPDRLRAWVLIRTRKDVTEEGVLRSLGPEELERQRQILEARGGDWLTARPAR